MKKNKLVIVFDENARREFLTGFHKRKLQRKNRAKEKLEMQLKAERKRIKAEAKKQYMQMLLAQKQIPELDLKFSENLDMGTHSVSITELSTADIARENNWIGVNEVQYQERESEKSDETDNESKSENELNATDINKKKKKSKKLISVPKTCKDVKKKIKQQATVNVKNSKIFKTKANLEKVKNIKLKKKKERKLRKLKKKNKRNKHNSTKK